MTTAQRTTHGIRFVRTGFRSLSPLTIACALLLTVGPADTAPTPVAGDSASQAAPAASPTPTDWLNELRADSGAEALVHELETTLGQRDRRLRELEVSHRRLWRFTLVGGIALVLAVALIGWVRFRTREREKHERQLVETALSESEERHRRLFERNLAGVFQIDLDGRILIANDAFADMLGYERGPQLQDRSLTSLTTTPDECRHYCEELAEGRELHNHELVLIRRDTTELPVLMNAVAVPASGGQGHVIEGIAIDISDRSRAEEQRRRLELQLQQSQRLESLGVLAGGIAHDFNNTLTAILSNISLAKRGLEGHHESVRPLGEAEGACLRATGLTQQLLTFSKGGRPIRKATELGTLVQEAAERVAVGGRCSLARRTSPDLWPVEIDQGQISQVVQNLVLNAVEAMPDGGVVSVECENVHLTEGDISTLEAGRYLRVDVTDTGAGIEEAEIDRIFDPFFTTKPSGSGLGLATAFSIVRSHGGAIVVQSDPGEGSRFSVVIPASDETRPEPETTTDTALSGDGRILIMDDDEAVRSAAAELLEAIGYEVETAADGAEAIDLYSAAMKSDRSFDAVVLDLTVPQGIGGRETMTRLLEIDPGVRAIVSSGYSTDPVMANYRDHGFSGVAVKPYRLEELAGTLSSAIESDHTG
jgi:PAS domain S-box-containing protein